MPYRATRVSLKKREGEVFKEMTHVERSAPIDRLFRRNQSPLCIRSLATVE